MRTFLLILLRSIMQKKKSSKSTVEEHLSNAPQLLIDLFKMLKEEIIKLPNVAENPVGPYIGYKFIPDDNKENRLFVEVHIQKRKKMIVLHLRPVEYADPENNIFQYNYVPKWPLRKGINIINEHTLNYALPFIKRSYNDVAWSRI
jgi:predicted transport protein